MNDFGVFTASTADEGDLSDPNEVGPVDVPRQETSNSRIRFRHQVMREMVTPPFRDQQQHEAKRTSLGAYNDQTDTQADTVFQKLGEFLRRAAYTDWSEPEANCIGGDAKEIYELIESVAKSDEPITWCKACGEEIPVDCHCKVPSPRQDKAW